MLLFQLDTGTLGATHYFGAYILSYTTNENIILILEEFGPQIKTKFLKQAR